MQILDSTRLEVLCVRIAGIDASIRAPRSVLAVLRRTLVHVCRPCSNTSETVVVEVSNDEFSWQIRGSLPRSDKVLSTTSPLPQVCGAIVSSLVAGIAQAAHLDVCRAAAVESEGRAVVFIGDDWESCIVLASHLHARGWHLLGGDYVLIDPVTLTVHATRKLLYVTLSIMDELPLPYRRAVEASPWYSTAGEIAFYAIDPKLDSSRRVWADSGRLGAVLKVDGDVSEFPSLERGPAPSISEGISGEYLERRSVATAEVKLGDYIATSDLLERWLQSLPAERDIAT